MHSLPLETAASTLCEPEEQRVAGAPLLSVLLTCCRCAQAGCIAAASPLACRQAAGPEQHLSCWLLGAPLYVLPCSYDVSPPNGPGALASFLWCALLKQCSLQGAAALAAYPASPGLSDGAALSPARSLRALPSCLPVCVPRKNEQGR